MNAINRWRQVRGASLGVLVVAWLAARCALGATPSQTFYVPFPEADAFAALTAVQPGDPPNNIPIPVNPMYTAISIAAIADGTVIYYDQWEDGYEQGHDYAAPQQATTKIWGDGNTANGFPPGLPSDLINAGTVILLTNNVVTTSPLTIDYDARDKIAATRTISVTRTYWAAGSSTLFAGCVETFDTGMWGTEYRAPIGQNLADTTDSQMFEYTAFSISAARDNTTVQIDADNNGSFEATVVLNEGQTHFISGVYVGGRVLADKPVQVVLFSGDVGSNYESRDSSLLPVSRWGSNYYSPVSTPSVRGTRVWLYNPGTSAITVTNNSRVGTGILSGGSIRVAAGSVTNVTLTENAAYRFFTASGSPFYAYSTSDSTDTDPANNQAFDWSFTLIPQQLLSPQVIVGLGIGRDPTSAVNMNENGNPIWVTPVGNGSTSVVVYVDYDGDNVGSLSDPYGNKYDYSTNLVELQQAKLYDPDGDQTAMLVYVLSTNVSLAVAWGQDPLKASTGAPGLDVGTSIPPVEVIDTAKNLTVVSDSDEDGQLGPGERARYTIRAGNAGRAPIPADFIVKDALPTNTTYVAGSTYYRTSTNGTWIGVTDDGSGTAFPLDVNGLRIQSILPVKGTFEVRFDVDVVSYSNLTAGAVSIVNTGTVHSVVYNRTLNFYNEYELHGSLGDRVWNDADNDGVQDVGETGINGVIVYLDANTNGVRDAGEPYDTTSGDGDYLLTGTYIEAGTHRVRVDRSTLSSNYVATHDLDGIGTVDAASVALAGGQDRVDVDFGYRLPARLGDFVWVDANGNGQQDGGETGLSNVVVRLYTNNVVMATVTSTVSGAYAFTNLVAGTYTVGFTPPSGYLFTSSNAGGNDAIDSDPLTGTNRTAAVTLVSGQTDNTVDAGFYQPATIGDFVWADANGNGQQDGGETGINGVTVTLFRPGYGPDGTPGNADDAAAVASQTTPASGAYGFTNLPPGTYQVGFGTAAGYYRTAADQGSDTTDSDANVGTGLTTAFAVSSGQTITTIDAGYQAVAVGDFVWTDADADGVQDAGEPGIAGVQVQLYTAAGAPYQIRTALGTFADNFDPSGGLTNSDGTLVWAADWTAANGATVVVNTGSDYEIQIADTANSTLTRSFTAPSGTARLTISFDYRSGAGNDTVQAQWSSNGTDWVMLASYSTAPGSSGTTNVTVATTAGTRYVRFTKTAQGGAGGSAEYMYFDNVSILAESAPAAVTATTDAYGYYLFGPSAGLLSGTNYQLRVATNQTALAGLALTGQNAGGNDATDSDATLATAVGFATLAFTAPAAGGSDQTLDFGFKGTASFGDLVWTDLDGDGSQDAFETGIPGVRVYVDSNGSGTYDAGEPAATTTAAGTYLITNLVAGTYAARVDTSTLPAGLAQTYDLNGALDHAASVTLTSGQARTDVDFGYRATAVYAIRGQVRDDYDLDGTFSDPDKPVGGVLVSLYSDPNGDGTNTDGVVLGTVRTSPDGRYAFTNVMSGAYVVVENDPTYSVSTADTVAANDNRIPVVIVSSDSVGNDFLDAVDPSGYIYDVADGRIVPGGRIEVSGPGALVLMDGSSGQYMFISTNDATSTFTIAVTPPPGYIIDPTRPAQPGSFDPTGGANPTVLGSYESAATPGYLVNYGAASNTYYYSFTLTPGDPPVINNNFPLVKTVTVGDRVWLDDDGDGAQDAGEPGVTNVTVRLLNAASSVVATTVTDAGGLYVFTNLPPASYRVEFAPVTEYRLTVRDSAAATDAADSDADALTGRTDLTAVAAGATNLTLDAGLYVPARVFGHLFVDKDGDLIRDTGDSSITNALVRLVVGGVTVASTNTDAVGYYFFGDVPAGTVSIFVSRASATLIDVPTADPALSDVRRNRGLPLPSEEAYIAHPVTSGYGVLASRPGEPLNFGFASYPLSTALDVSLYATGDGGVMIELWTVNEAGQGDIVIYAWIDNAWAEVGRVPGDQVRGDGSNRYTVLASGLTPGASYNLKIIDEVGHVHESGGPLAVRAIRMEAVRLNMQTLSVSFRTEEGRRYTVMVSTDLVTWAPEYVSFPTVTGWSEYTDEPFTARGPRTEVLVPVNGRAKAFFKAVMVQE